MAIEKKVKETIPKKFQEKKVEEQRTKPKKVYYNSTEWNEVEKLSKLTGDKLGIYIRKASLLPAEKLIEASAFYLGVRSEIRKVGVNVNQIARVLNASKDVNDPDLKKDLEEVKTTLYNILNSIS